MTENQKNILKAFLINNYPHYVTTRDIKDNLGYSYKAINNALKQLKEEGYDFDYSLIKIKGRKRVCYRMQDKPENIDNDEF
jgi:biotin operon repressor